MAAHKHGSMDITAQKQTFEGFVKTAVISVAVVVVILLLLTFRI